MTFISKLLHYWKNFDIFGVAPVLSFHGKGKQKTSYGGVISTLIFVYMILAFIISFDDMVFRQNPNIVISNDAGRQSGVRFSKDSFNMGVSFFNPTTGGIVTDPTIVQYSAHQFKVDFETSSGSSKPPEVNPIPLKNCDPANFQNLSSSNYLKNQLCIDMDHPNATLGIAARENIIFLFKQCSNTTIQTLTGNSSLYCKSQQEIDNIFNTHAVALSYSDFYVDPHNFDNPIRYFFQTSGYQNSAKLTKRVRVVLEEFDFISDKGYFLSDKSTESHLRLIDIKPDVNENGNPLFSFDVALSGKKQVQTRSYIKFQQALAGAVSLIRAAMLFCTFFIIPCQKIRYFQDMITELFSIRTIDYGRNSSSKKYQLKQDFRMSNQGGNANYNNHSFESSSSIGGPSKFIEMQKLERQARQLGPLSAFKQQQGLRLDSESSEMIGFDKSKDQDQQSDSEEKQEQQSIAVSPQQSPKEDDHYNDKKIEIKQQQDQQQDQVKKEDNNNLPQKQSQESESNQPNDNNDNYQQIEVEDYNSSKDGKKPFSGLLIKSWWHNNFSCYKDEEKIQFKSGRNKVLNELSVLSIIKKLRDLDRLKCLLLDEEQRVLFDNLPLPAVCGPSHIPNLLEKELISQKEELNREQKFKRVKEYYSKIAQRPIKNNSDMQLLQWFETGDYFN